VLSKLLQLLQLQQLLLLNTSYQLSPFSITTKGQWLQMNMTRVALAPAEADARLTALPVRGSGSCRQAVAAAAAAAAVYL
jgi:hypothetical protein